MDGWYEQKRPFIPEKLQYVGQYVTDKSLGSSGNILCCW